MVKHKLLDRFLEVLNYLEAKYVNILEEVIASEAEVYGKDRLEPIDYLKLYCYTIIKRIIIEELGLEKPTVDNTVPIVKIEV